MAATAEPGGLQQRVLSPDAVASEPRGFLRVDEGAQALSNPGTLQPLTGQYGRATVWLSRKGIGVGRGFASTFVHGVLICVADGVNHERGEGKNGRRRDRGKESFDG